MFATLQDLIFRLFSYRKVSAQLDPRARENLRNDVRAAFFDGMFVGGCIQLLPYVAKKFANASDLEVEWLFRINAIGMASAVFVPMLLHGAGKVRQRLLLSSLRNIVILTLPIIYFLTVPAGHGLDMPADSAFNFWFMAVAMAAAVLSIASITSVAGLSMEMYPDHLRMQAVGCVTQVNIITIVGTNLITGPLLDHQATAFWWLFPALTFPSFLGLRYFARLRSPVEESGRTRFLSFTLFDILRIPLRNRRFWLYQLTFSLGGLPNLMVMPLYLIFISDRQYVNLDYRQIALITVTTSLAGLFTVNAWARLLDRFPNPFVGRGMLMVVWIFHPLTYAAAVLTFAYASPVTDATAWVLFGILMLTAFLQGTLNAGGSLNWLLGSPYFARSGEAAMYSGAHMIFNAIRAFFGPMLGMGLYRIFNHQLADNPWHIRLFGADIPISDGFFPTFLIAAALMAIAAIFQFLLRWHYGPMPLPSAAFDSGAGRSLPAANDPNHPPPNDDLTGVACKPSQRLAPQPFHPGGPH